MACNAPASNFITTIDYTKHHLLSQNMDCYRHNYNNTHDHFDILHMFILIVHKDIM